MRWNNSFAGGLSSKNIKNNKKKSVIALAAASAVAGIAGYGQTARAGTVVENGSANSLSSGGAWVGGVAPASTDIAQFGNSITGAYSQPLGSSTNWGEIQVLNPGGPITISPDGNSLTITGIAQATGTLGIDMSAATQSLTINSGLILGSTQQWNVASGQTLNIGGVISDGGNAYGFNANGPGTVSLTAANTYTGVTQVTNGTLTLDYSSGSVANNIIAATSALTIGGAGNSTLNLYNGGSSASPTQTFSSTTVGVGLNQINIVNTGSGTPVLNLGNITGGAGSHIVFSGVSTTGAGGVGVAGVGTIVGTGSQSFNGLLENNNGTDGALGTVGLYDWAAVNANGQIVGGSTIAGFYLPTSYSNVNSTTTGNLDLSGAASSHNTDTDGGIRFNTPIATNVTLTSFLTGNGILVTPNVGAVNDSFIGNTQSVYGTRSSGNGELPIFQNNTLGMLIINGVGQKTTPTPSASISQNGAGTTFINTASSYTGQTFLNGGNLEVAADSGLGAPTSATSGQIMMQGGGLFASTTFALSTNHSLVLSGAGGTLSAQTGSTLTVPGTITGAGALNFGIGTLPGTGAGTANTTAQIGGGVVVVSNAGNTFVGPVNVNNGTLQVDGNVGTGKITVNSGGTLSGVASLSNPVSVASGGAITGGDALASGTLGVGSLNLASGSIFDSYFNGVAFNSEINISNGLTIGSGAIVNLYQVGGTTTFAGNGTYTLFDVTGGGVTGSVANLSVGDQQGGATYTFNNNSGLITLTISGGTAYPIWTGAAGTSWNTAGDWVTNAVPNGQGMTAYFNTQGAGSVTLDAAQVVGGIVLNSGTSYNFTPGTGGTLTFNNGAGTASIIDALGTHTFNVPVALPSKLAVAVNNSTDSVTLAGAVSGTGGITLSGLGTLSLTGTNSFSGGVVATGGFLGIANDSSLGAVPGTASLNLTFNPGTNGTAGLITTGNTTLNANRQISVQSGLTIINNNGNTDVINGAISGSGNVTYTGAGTTTLGTANSNGGTTTIAGGTVVLGNTGAMQLTTLNYNNQGGSLSFGSLTAATLGGLSGSQNLTLTNNSSGNVALSVGNNNASTNYSGSISGGGSLTKIGSGTLALSGSDSYGATNFNAGIVNFTPGALGSGPLTFNGGTLQWANGNSSDISGVTVTFASTAILDTNGNNVEFTNPIGNNGTGGLTKNGLGTLQLDSTNTYSGPNTVNNGLLAIGVDANLGAVPTSTATANLTFAPAANTTAGLLVLTPATLSANRTVAITGSGVTTIDNSGNTIGIAGIITGGGNVDYIGAGTTTLSNANTNSGTTIIGGTTTLLLANSLAMQDSTLNYNGQGGSLSFGNLTAASLGGLSGSQTLALTNASSNPVALTVGANNATTTYSGQLSGVGSSLTKVGTGLLVLNTTNTYTGATNFNGGLINFIPGALGSGPLIFNGGGLQWATGNTLDLSTSGQTVTFNGPATIDTNGNNVTFSAAVGNSGTGGLFKSGLGTLYLPVANAFSGPGGVNNGTLAIAGDTSLGTVPSSPKVDFTFSPASGSTATLLFTAATNLNANRGIAFTGAGVSIINNGGFADSINGAKSGGGNVTFTGAGSVTLSAASTDSGTTVIAGGSVLLTNPLALAGTTLNYNNQGGTLNLGSLTSATFGGLSGSQSLVLTNSGSNPIALTVGGNNSTTTYSGNLTGPGASLTKTGTGILTLNNTGNTYSGGTNLLGGEVGFAAGSLPAGGVLNFNGGGIQWAAGNTTDISGTMTTNFIGNATLDTNTNNVTLASAIGNSGTGNLLHAGANTLTLLGPVTSTGGVQSNVGTLLFGPGSSWTGTFANAANGAQLAVGGGTLVASALSFAGTGNLSDNITAGSITFNGGVFEDPGAAVNSNIQVTGTGTLTTTFMNLGRTQGFTALPTAAATASGLYVNGGVVNITGALNAGNNTLTNSSTNVRIDNGSVTVGGTTSINNNNNSRWSVFQVNGGTFTSNDSTGAGVLVGGFNAATDDEFLVSGGTSTVQKITLGNAPQATGTNVLSLTGGALYIGAGGIVSGVATPTYTNLITLGNGTIGAAADWSSTLPMTLTGSTGTTFLTSNLAGTGHNITLKGVVSGTGKLIVSGTGSLTLTAANTYTGPTTVNSGTLNLNNPQAIVATGTLNVGGTGTVVLSETQGTTNLAALNVTGNGTFDVTNNAVFINYSAAGQTSPDAAIRSALISGSGTNGVTYNGVGIISSTAARLNAALVANNGTPAYGVGYADGSDPYLNNEGPAAGVEEVKLTLLGDLNLDGFVNSADFILFANSFGKTGGTAAAWDHGDLNYDGSVNSADFILFADEFGKGLGTVSSTDGGLTLAQGGLDAAQVQQFNQIGTDLGISSTELAQLDLKVAAVPEPASLGLLVIGGLGLMGRRRRRNA